MPIPLAAKNTDLTENVVRKRGRESHCEPYNMNIRFISSKFGC
jgi:hypothetical protein